jgi:hypothetical protein
MNDGPNPFTWEAQLLSYWYSRNTAVFQDYLVNLISNLRDSRAKDLSAPRGIYSMNRSVLLKLDESHGFTSIINIDPYLTFRIFKKMSSRSRVWLRFSSCPRARMPCEPHIPDTSLGGSCHERKTYAAIFYRTAYAKKGASAGTVVRFSTIMRYLRC